MKVNSNKFSSFLTPNRITTLLCFLFCDLLLIHVINIGWNRFRNGQNNRTSNHNSNNSKIYIAIITQSQSKRNNIFQTKWIAKIKNSIYFDRAVFVTDGNIDLTGINDVNQNNEKQNEEKPTNENKKQSFKKKNNKKVFVLSIPDEILSNNVKQLNKTYRRERLACNADKQTKFNYSMYDFITNSEADWYINIDNDSGVIPANFDDFMEDLNKKYDPKKQIIFRGSGAFAPYPRVCFPGGGLGLLLSRKAALETFKVWPNFFNKMNEPEDYYMTKIVHYFKQTMLDFHLDGFSTGLKNYDVYQMLEKKQYDNIPLCPLEPLYPECSATYFPLNKLVFYHRVTSYPGIEKLIEEGIPDEVKLVHTIYIHNMCWEDKNGQVTNPNRKVLFD